MSEIIEIMARALAVSDPQGRGMQYWRDYVPDAKSATTALESSGFAIVPVKPTFAMIDAGVDSEDRDGWSGPENCWERMVKAWMVKS